jgi:hypothetical protein
MDSSSVPSSTLPLWYRLVIAFSAISLFLLGLAYFGFLLPDRGSTFRLYGSPTLWEDLPAAFSLVEMDSGRETPVPCRVTAARLTTQDRIIEGPQLASLHNNPSLFSFPSVALPTGEAVLHITVEGWDSRVRELSVPLRIRAKPHALPDPALVQPAFSPVDGGRYRVSLIPARGGMPDGLPSTLWVRITDGEDRGVPVSLTWSVEGGAHGEPLHTGHLGLASLPLALSGVNPLLELRLVPEGDEAEIVWQEYVPPDRRMTFVPEATLLRGEAGATMSVQVQTVNPDERMFCSVWYEGVPIQCSVVPLDDRKGSLDLRFPAEGLYYLACSGYAPSSVELAETVAIGVFRDPQPFLAALAQRLSLSLPPAEAPERSLAEAYVMDVVQPRALAFSTLLNTMEQDQHKANARAHSIRQWLLLLMGVVGGLLAVWAVLVVVLQQRRLRRGFRDFTIEEDVGDELQQQGLTRRQPPYAFILLIVTAMANLAALIWLFQLIV